jgi:hypothetical protein
LGAIRERQLNITGLRDDVQAREDVTLIVNDNTAPEIMLYRTMRARDLRLDDNERRLYHLVHARRKGSWRCSRCKGLGNRDVDLTLRQLMWTGDEHVVKQERHESGGHARCKKRHGPCRRAEVLQASSPPLRS